MYKDELIKAGLSESEAKIYEYLLQNGESNALAIINGTELKRGNCYNVLESLVIKGLILETDTNKIAHWKIEDPQALVKNVENEKKNLDFKINNISNILPSIIQKWNLSTHRPVATYYEGQSGFEAIVADTLTSKTEILQYLDLEIADKNFRQLSEEQVKKRAKLGIIKKILAIDNEYTRNFYKDLKEGAESHVRLIKAGNMDFNVTMFIYDSKVAYVNMIQGNIIGLIIHDPNIYNMHKIVFENLYSVSSDVKG